MISVSEVIVGIQLIQKSSLFWWFVSESIVPILDLRYENEFRPNQPSWPVINCIHAHEAYKTHNLDRKIVYTTQERRVYSETSSFTAGRQGFESSTLLHSSSTFVRYAKRISQWAKGGEDSRPAIRDEKDTVIAENTNTLSCILLSVTQLKEALYVDKVTYTNLSSTHDGVNLP